eukprot:c11174_g1_i2.p1 GENE.c11174_g1_i2~~c11174_g1_i2.p1  ORF type:complete len:147 (+),score=12.75 c11174_g1_i2:125-565(+)
MSYRIRKELEDIAEHPVAGCIVGADNGDIHSWVVVIDGPADTVYEGGTFFLSIKLSSSYPFEPPMVVFRTKIFHCNVDPSGRVHLPMLCNNWTPATKLQTVLRSVLDVLASHDTASAVQGKIAKLLLTNRETHDQIARDWTKRFAT